MGHTCDFGAYHICAKKPPLNASEVRGPYFIPSLYLLPFFVYVSSKGSGETAQARLSVHCSRLCDKSVQILVLARELST